MRTPWLILLPLLVAFPLFADLPVAAPTLRPATGAQSLPVLASSGTDALAAWRDERAMVELPSITPTSPEREVYAARISADGTPGPNFDVTPNVEEDVAPAAVWNGDEYVVAHLMTPRFGFEGGIRFTRVKPGDTADNRLIPRSEYAPAPAFGLFGNLALAWNGEEYLAVMSAQFTGQDNSVWGLLVDRSFHPIGPAFRIASGDTSLATAASDGRGFFVTWVDARRIGAAVVSPAGSVAAQPLLSEPPTSGFSTSAPAVVWNGQRYLVTWSDPVVRARFVASDGTPASPVLDLFGAGRNTAVAWNGSEYLLPFITEGDRFDLYALRLDAAGEVLDGPFPIAASQTAEASPAAVAIGDRFLVAWSDDVTIRSAVVAGGVPQKQEVVAQSLGAQFNATGLFDGTNYVFTWQEDANIFLGRVTAEGEPLDGGGILLGSGFDPILAFNGEQYAVAILLPDGNQSAVVRVDRSGKVLDPAPVVVPRVAAIASDGRDFLLVSLLSAQPARIRPAILTPAGVLLPQPPIADLPFDSTNPAVAWTGTHYVLVYTQFLESFCFKCNQKYEMHTVLLDRTGNVASPIRTIAAAQGAPVVFQVARVVSGGGSTIAVFGGSSGATVARIEEAGVPAITAQLQDSFYPNSGIWTGSDFVFTSLTRQPAQRIAPDGSLLQAFPVGDPSTSPPTLVAGAPRLAIVYDRPERIAGQGTIRRAFFDFVQERRRRAR